MSEYEIADLDLNKFDRMKVKHPNRIKEVQRIPTHDEGIKLGELIAYNGLWLILTYGADLLSMINPWLGKGFSGLVSLRFKGNWKQKQVTL
jgi:hypothetical protein